VQDVVEAEGPGRVVQALDHVFGMASEAGDALALGHLRVEDLADAFVTAAAAGAGAAATPNSR